MDKFIHTIHNKKNVFLIIAILALLPSSVFLISRSAQIESWDNWYSSMSLLTVRYWVRDGFLNHKLLFLPAGYHPEIQVLDRPEFQFLADGIFTGGLIGKRVYYTHYPPAAVIPYALLGELGTDSKFLFRILSMVFSFAFVGFLAGVVYFLTDRNRWIALLAGFYYITSSNFLAYADAPSTMVPDDFLKGLIFFLSVFSWQCVTDERVKKKLKIGMWILFLFLAFTSYDSIFFIFFWLCALHAWTTRRFSWKEWLYWATAPIAAFGLQIAQNTWYLGWHDMLLDFYGVFVVRSSEAPAVLGGLPPVIKNVFAALSTFGYGTDLQTRFILPLLVLVTYLLWKRRVNIAPSFSVIFFFVAAGMIYGLIFPVAGTFGYQGRQMAPVLMLLVGIATYEAVKGLKEKRLILNSAVLGICMTVIWTAHFYGAYAYAKDWPNNVFPKQAIAYLQEMRDISDPSTMIFRTESNIIAGERFDEQYYADRLILSFTDVDTLLAYMDKIYSAIPGKVNFLLFLTNEEYKIALDGLRALPAYSAEPQRTASLPGNLNLIKVTR